MEHARRVELRQELIRLAQRRDLAALRAFVAKHPLYDADLNRAVAAADDDSLLALLVTMASYAKKVDAPRGEI
ncbi:MAG TPA: hypothetical protein VG370_21790 [Chloroflexota bacterium]|jgi:hypothetical protein|nr:hypothetical protein [Chloroflexota bacterium]